MVLCDSFLNSSCWQSNCEVCENGKTLPLDINPETYVSWKEWCFVEVSQNVKKLQCQVRTGCASELTEILRNQCLSTLTYINIKRIQSSQFQTDLVNPNICVLQIDFAMSYSCECQDEVQSALWSRESKMLFTASHNVKHIFIASDSRDKGKDTVTVFIDFLYTNCCACKCEEYIA